MSEPNLPLLPLILDDVPPGLVRVLGQEGVPFQRRESGPMAGRFVLFDSRRGPRHPTGYGQVPIDVDRLRDGSTPDPLVALMDEGSHRHQWQVAGLTLSEEIARVDRRALRAQVLGRLREMIERAGGIWLCVAAVPFPYRSAMNFRIDYDRYDRADFDATMDAVAGHEGATSHFVNAAAYLPHDDALARLAGLDVGSHGFRHHTYPTRDENLTNVLRGIETLRAMGIEPSGFAAPGGRFNRGLLEALEALRVGHSSEFGLAYDELPFFPDDGKVLQVPIHPVCLGLFLEALGQQRPASVAATQRAVRAAIDYFRETARSKYRSGELVFFYGHPTARLGSYPQVLRAIFDTADSFGLIWKTTLSEFAAWWRVRAEIRMTVTRRAEQFVIEVGKRPKGYRVSFEYWRGRHIARMPLHGNVLRFTPSALAYENRTIRPGVRPVRVDPPHGLRGRIRRWVDWERETPIEEIHAGSWRSLIKKTLRRWRR